MRESYPPVVFAHRGASKAFRENTVEAFRGAATLGADWVELDVRISAEGVPVVHHDPGLPGAVRGAVPIAGLRLDELPEWLPVLADALTACKLPSARSGRLLGVNVEIKCLPDEPGYDPDFGFLPAVLDVVARHLEVDRVLVSSFDWRALARVRTLAPHLRTAQLTMQVGDAEVVVARAVKGGHVAINAWNHAATRELVDAAHAAGLAINVWTVDDPDRMVELCELGVDGIITNVPDVCARVVDDFERGADPDAGGVPAG